MRKVLLILCSAALACLVVDHWTSERRENRLLGDYGPAAPIERADRWFNSDPMSPAQLRGKVILLEFWSYSCINCVHTVPSLNRLYLNYQKRGLSLIAVHTPEFDAERDGAGLEKAIRRLGIKYPVVQDNSRVIWQAYQNQFWPSIYLIDRKGQIVFKHVGEGDEELIENAVREAVK